MDIIKKTTHDITKHALQVINKLSEDQISAMIDNIIASDSIFIVGSGRSELVGKAFAMRLMHLGFSVHVVGDVTTPAITKNDCLIAISGSGETKTVILAAEASKNVKAQVMGVTAKKESTLNQYLDVTIYMDSKTKEYIENEAKEPWKYYTAHVLKGDYDDLTPLGTMFEYTALLFLDGLIAEFMYLLGKKEQDLKNRHATIE